MAGDMPTKPSTSAHSPLAVTCPYYI